MIQERSILNVADNSGARKLRCFRIVGDDQRQRRPPDRPQLTQNTGVKTKKIHESAIGPGANRPTADARS